MEYLICSKGHYYYPSVNSSCPVCEAERRGGKQTATIFTNFTEQLSDAVIPGGDVGFNAGGRDDITGSISRDDFENNTGMTEPLLGGFTEPLDNKIASFTESYTVPLDPESNDDFAYTTPIVEDFDITRSVYRNQQPDFEPVTGWLVSISGFTKGSDFKIHSGYNYIGRDPSMDICIPGDMEMSRKNAAVIGFDSVEKLFLFGPTEGRNFVRLNGKAILGQTEIKSFDRLKIGSTEFIFVALCGDGFCWDE